MPALLATGVLVSVLSLGGQSGPGLIVACVLALAAAAFALRDGATVPLVAWASFALAGFSAMQALPLPLGWIERLSPQGFEVWSRSLRAFRGAAPEFGALSLDPGASWVEALKWSTYGYLFVACAAVRARAGAVWLASLVFCVGVFIACTTLAHGLLDARMIFGLYEPTFAVERWSRGPLLNSNNLAGYANLALFSGIGVWLSTRRRLPTWFLVLGGMSLVAVVLLSGSRAGVGSLVLGALILAAWLTVMRRQEISAKVGVGAVVAVGACAVMVTVADERVYQALGSTDIEQKVSVWSNALDMVRDYWAFGAGRGSFESAFASYHRPASGDFASIVSHAENFPIQFLTEWGVAVGGLTLLLGAWGLGRAVWGSRGKPVQAALAVGICVVLLQNLADLGLEIPALMMALVVVASSVLRREDPLATRSFPATAVRMLPALVAVAVAFWPAQRGVQSERAALATRFESAKRQPRAERESLRRHLEQATRRHPAEPYFAYLTALVAYREKDVSPLPALERALERFPYHGATHLLLAHVLARRGARSQALLHLRLAATYDRQIASIAADRALRWARDGDELVRALPPDKEAVSAVCRRLPPSERAIACWKGYASLDPSDLSAERWLAGAWLDLIERNMEPCATSRAMCERAVEDSIGRLRRHRGAGVEKVLSLEARLKALRGFEREAARDLLAACPLTESGLECHELVLDLAQRGGENDVLIEAVERWLSLICAGRPDCSEEEVRAGRLLATAGAPALALRHFTEAARRSPSVARWLDVANVALSIKNAASARVALDRARQLGPASDDERGRLTELESRAAGLR